MVDSLLTPAASLRVTSKASETVRSAGFVRLSTHNPDPLTAFGVEAFNVALPKALIIHHLLRYRIRHSQGFPQVFTPGRGGAERLLGRPTRPEIL
jgi:hypothetical protein